MLNSLFWIGAYHHRPTDLPDTNGLNWREAIIRCLESIYPLSRTTQDPEPSPPSSRCAEQKPEPTADGKSPSALWLEDPLSPPPDSESWTPSRPIDPAAPPWLLAPSSPPWPSVHQIRRAPSSLQLHLGQSSAICRLGTPLLWLRFVPLSLCLCQAPPYLPLHHGIPYPRFGCWSQLHRLGSPDPPHHPSSSALRLCFGLHHHLLRRRWSAPGVGSPFSIMVPPSGSTVGYHYGCGLGPAWLLLLQVPHVLSLAPPSVSSTLDSVCHPPPGFPSSTRTSSSFVCQPFAGPCHHPFSTPCVLLLSSPLLPPFISVPRGHAFREGVEMSYTWTFCCVFSPHVLYVT